jgi:hypothetical protein
MIRGSCYIPPPFPWLHQWDTVREVQQATGIHKWTVSSVSDNNMNKTIESTGHDGIEVNCRGVEVDCSDDEATILVPNEFILDRLQNTMKKMNNKAKKARKMNRRMKRALVKDT